MEQEAVNAAQPAPLDEEQTEQVAGGFVLALPKLQDIDKLKLRLGDTVTPTPVKPKPVDR